MRPDSHAGAHPDAADATATGARIAAVSRVDSVNRRPDWIPTLAAFATVVLCVVAGNWQHRRMNEKEALQAQMSAAAAAIPAPLPNGAVDWQAWRFRPVIVTGRFDAARQILIDNKVRAGYAGFDVVTPLALDDGGAVLVDRGWIAVGRTRAALPDVPPPKGVVTVRGRVDIPASGYLELGDAGAPSGPLWEHLDPARFAAATGLRVLPIVVLAFDGAGGDELVRDWTLPDTGTERHLSYMLQWYTFAAMAAGLWLWFTVRPGLMRGVRRNAS